ncbi:hypothetical protein DCAR_0830369 [Daucus carota subsp. sativus]|uniref:Uncharacterized protein n=1 Tax=Daucus carota subsp. sativus TaxID=79200 RepID=A0AAF0XPJ7_DAUCS|nr:hypothetical protein DCAR_0830369 [Daucus carota subsp. sativus]
MAKTLNMSESHSSMLQRFGEDTEESRLMDRYERMSFEMELNKAIYFGRSLSVQPRLFNNPPLESVNVVSRGPLQRSTTSRATSPAKELNQSLLCLKKVVKKLLKPLKIMRSNKKLSEAAQPKDLSSWKRFSRSVHL